jgi:ferric-dicitrate binding protein FerR (iron transport regulator)
LITFSRFGAILLFAGTITLPLFGALKKEARVTQVIRDVRLLVSQAGPRPASLNDQVVDGTAIRTGADSRAELTFPDLTITRVGANSIFSFDRGGRSVDVESGAILLRVPRDSSGAHVHGDVLTVGITGTTLLFESRPSRYNKLIILEGAARAALRLYPAQVVTVRAGQMLVVESGATTLPNPVAIDLDRLMKTATLITKFRPLPSLNLILAAIDNQKRAGLQLINPDFMPTGLDARDVVAAIRSQSTPRRTKSGKPPQDSRKP